MRTEGDMKRNRGIKARRRGKKIKRRKEMRNKRKKLPKDPSKVSKMRFVMGEIESEDVFKKSSAASANTVVFLSFKILTRSAKKRPNQSYAQNINNEEEHVFT